VLEPLASDDPRQVDPYTLEGRLGGNIFVGRRTDGTAVVVRLARDADSGWVATAYDEGPSLRDVVREDGPLAVRDVLRLTAGIAGALAALHGAGRAHQDVTASKVVLSPEGPRLTEPAGADEGAPADVFALGVLVTYLATGRVEFGVGRLTEVPEPLRALARRCLATTAVTRPTAAEIVEYCEAELADGQPREQDDPLAYVGTAPPENPLDLSAGIPSEAIVGPLTGATGETPDEDPLAYPATDPPENPLDLSAGIPSDAIVGPIPAPPETPEPKTPEPATPEPVADPPAGAAPVPAAPTIEPDDLAALRAAADTVAAAAASAAATAAHTATAAVIDPLDYVDRHSAHHRRRRILAGLTAAIFLVAAVVLVYPRQEDTAGTPIADEDAVLAGPPTTGPTCAGAKHLLGSGSTLQHDAMITIAEQWAARCAGSRLDYTSAGTTYGVQQFATGETDLAVADHVLGASQGEIAAAAARCAGVGAPADKNLVLQVPTVLTPIALPYHLSGVTELRLDAPTVSAIFSGKITQWNDRTITALNPGIRLPATGITVIARADEAVSTETLQQYLTIAGGWDSGAGPGFTGKAAALHQSDTAVFAAVRAIEGAIGYLPHPLTRPTDEPVASLVTSDGQVAEPDADAVTAAVDDALQDTDDYTLLPAGIFHAGAGPADETDQVGVTTAPYPLVHVGYVVSCTQYPDHRKSAAIRDFLLTALGMQVESARGYQLPFGELRLRLVDLVDHTY